MFLGGETADQYEKKGSRAQGRHVIWETAAQLKKGIVDSRGRKPAEKTRAQCPKSNFRKKGLRAQGSHVVWKTADQLKKGIAGSGKSRGLGNRCPVEKRDRGLKGKENR